MVLRTLDDLITSADPADTAYVAESGPCLFQTMEARVRSIAAHLSAQFDRGEVVAILGENSGAYVELLYAIPTAGMQALLLNYRHTPHELAAMLMQTSAVAIAGDSQLLAPLLNAVSARPLALPALRECILIDDHPQANPVELSALPSVAISSYQVIVGSASADEVRIPAETHPHDVAWLVPTSGTTGSPKLAMLTHHSLLTAAAGCHMARPVADDDIYLYAFPLCHVAAYNVLVYHQRGRPIVVMRKFDPQRAVELICEFRVTAASLAPTMIAMLLDTPGLLDGNDVSSLRSIGYGSSGIPVPILRRAMSRFGCGFSQGYGMTELSGNAVFLSADDHLRGVGGEPDLLTKAGTATPLAEIRIVRDDGTAADANEVGEIEVRGEQVMAGYYNDDAASTAAVVDGWLRTGDLGCIDDVGYLRVVDRKKDVIITGGENVASREVEAVLHEDPSVREAAVIGVRDERWGEVVTAVVVLIEGAKSVAADDEVRQRLTAHCRATLAGYKVPRAIHIVPELPKNTTGKIEKHELRKRFAPL